MLSVIIEAPTNESKLVSNVGCWSETASLITATSKKRTKCPSMAARRERQSYELHQGERKRQALSCREQKSKRSLGRAQSTKGAWAAWDFWCGPYYTSRRPPVFKATNLSPSYGTLKLQVFWAYEKEFLVPYPLTSSFSLHEATFDATYSLPTKSPPPSKRGARKVESAWEGSWPSLRPCSVTVTCPRHPLRQRPHIIRRPGLKTTNNRGLGPSDLTTEGAGLGGQMTYGPCAKVGPDVGGTMGVNQGHRLPRPWPSSLEIAIKQKEVVIPRTPEGVPIQQELLAST